MKKSLLILGIINVVICILPISVISAEEELEVLIQEFLIAETVHTQEKGEVQFTLGSDYWEEESIRIPMLFEYGITDRLQIQTEIPYLFLNSNDEITESGIGDIEAGILYNFLRRKEPFALSVKLDVGLPVGDKGKGLGEEKTEWQPSVILARQIGKGQIHLGIGGGFTEDGSELIYNLAGIYPFRCWGTTFELNWIDGSEKKVYLTPGVICHKLKGFEFGLGTPIGITEDASDWGIIFKVTYEFSIKSD